MRAIIPLSFISYASAFSWMAGHSPRDVKIRAALGKLNVDNLVAPILDEFPYIGAKNGLPGTGKGGFVVPAPGDTAHAFRAPSKSDIRGPCPGMNMAANHGFISRDGRTTYNELMDVAQNAFNIGFDLATILVATEFALSGNLLNQKITIGRFDPSYTGDKSGFAAHNSLSLRGGFEADASLSRNDDGLNGDALSASTSQFAMLHETCNNVSNGLFNLECATAFRKRAYEHSIATNPNFYFGPIQLFLYGAATFLWEILPSGGPDGVPDAAAINAMFGAVPQKDGSFKWVPEQFPQGWRSRKVPFTFVEGSIGIWRMYLGNPVLFGGNNGKVNSFVPMEMPSFITNGTLNQDIIDQGATGLACFLYNAILLEVGGPLLKDVTSALANVRGILDPVFGKYGCI